MQDAVTVPDAVGGVIDANFGAGTGAINVYYRIDSTGRVPSSIFILGHQLKCVLLVLDQIWVPEM